MPFYAQRSEWHFPSISLSPPRQLRHSSSFTLAFLPKQQHTHTQKKRKRVFYDSDKRDRGSIFVCSCLLSAQAESSSSGACTVKKIRRSESTVSQFALENGATERNARTPLPSNQSPLYSQRDLFFLSLSSLFSAVSVSHSLDS